jgi:antitoxin component YwqK of YwqJK toxin-antitoxin module
MEIIERYFENGQLMLHGYLDNSGEAQGQWKSFHNNGQLEAQGNYIDNQKDGLWQYYYTNGQIKAIVNYEYGIPDGTQKYFKEDGSLDKP